MSHTLKGKTNSKLEPCMLHVADALSRNYLPETEEDEYYLVPVFMINTLPISDDKLEQIAEETERDPLLSKLAPTLLILCSYSSQPS